MKSLRDAKLKSLFFVVLISLITYHISLITASADTHTAANCSQAAVQAAISAAGAGDTVAIPAGTATWTSPISWNAPANVTLQGAGSQSVTGGGDVTVLIDNIARGSSDSGLLEITTSGTGGFRITGITFQGSGSSGAVTWHGSVRIYGTSQQFRMDHVHFKYINAIAMDIAGWLYGVMDHNLFDMVAGTTNNGVRIEHGEWGGKSYGDGSWADDTTFGSNRFIFLEDSVFNNGFANDCDNGGRFVVRHNTFNDSPIQGHEMIQRMQGCRAFETYDNNFIGQASNPQANACFFRTGTGLFWNNTVTNYVQFGTFYNDRSDTFHAQSAPPNGWGYCGNTYGPSIWDGNTNSYGYPCFEQIGRGKGDLLTNYFPNVIDTITGTATWPHQALEPVYLWNNSHTPPPNYGNRFLGATDNVIVENRDYFLDDTTHGVTSGPLSSRPATCSVNTAYWATDTNTLYKCTATNTWTSYYTPYTYPHPLTGGSAPTDTTAPSNIAAVNDGSGADISSTLSTTQLQANWTASSDPEGFSGYKYAIGTTAGATNTANWTTLGNVLSVTRSGLTLTIGATYYFSVKAVNTSGLESSATNSNGQFVKGDTTAPGAPAAVRDGTGNDASSTTLTTALNANWDAAVDPESSITKYYYAIGTAAGATNITLGWIDNGAGLSVARTGLTLTVGTTYYFSVKAQNSSGLQGTARNSNGICIVTQVGPGPEPTPVISGVGVTNLTDKSATIVWDTDLDTKGQVQYGTTLNYIGGGEESALSKRHMIDLKSLEPETRYHYKVLNIDGNGNTVQSGDYTFKTYALITRPTPIVGKVYPNPYKLADTTQMTFALSSATGGSIKIYTLSGKLVKNISVTSGNTDALWNLTNESGNRINGGLYVYIMSDSDGNKRTGKIVITN
jgi:hypothetical protein